MCMTFKKQKKKKNLCMHLTYFTVSALEEIYVVKHKIQNQ